MSVLCEENIKQPVQATGTLLLYSNTNRVAQAQCLGLDFRNWMKNLVEQQND